MFIDVVFPRHISSNRYSSACYHVTSQNYSIESLTLFIKPILDYFQWTEKENYGENPKISPIYGVREMLDLRLD